MNSIILISIIAISIFAMIFTLISRYKRCPSDQLLVVYGKTGKKNDGSGDVSSARVYHGGGAFIWPVIQDYEYLDLKPMTIDVKLQNALSKQNIRISVPSTFTVAISSNKDVRVNAAESLLGLNRQSIAGLAQDIIFGQMRQVIAQMTIEEINADRDKFLKNISVGLEDELTKIGMRLINVNVTDINDNEGYLEALGKEASERALADAKIAIAEKRKIGAIGEAKANRERNISVASEQSQSEIGVAEADQKQRVATSKANSLAEIGEANAAAEAKIGTAAADTNNRVRSAELHAEAVAGENKSAANIATTTSARKVIEAEENRKAITAQKVKAAKALEDSYVAEKAAEISRAEKEKSSLIANVIVPAEIDRERVEIEALAEANKNRELAKGEADAIFAKMEAEAKGDYARLSEQAKGIAELVDAAGSAENAISLMVADKLESLYKIRVEAIKNIKIDKLTVWDQGTGSDGKNSTAGFMDGLIKSVPGFEEVFAMAGTELPSLLQGAGTKVKNELDAKYEKAKELKSEKDSSPKLTGTKGNKSDSSGQA